MGFSYVWRGVCTVCVAKWRLSQSISHQSPASVPLWNTAASSELARGLAHTHILTFTFTPWNAHTLKISMLPVLFFYFLFFAVAAAVGWIWLRQSSLSKSPWVWAPIISSAAPLSHNPPPPADRGSAWHLWMDSSVKKLGFQTFTQSYQALLYGRSKSLRSHGKPGNLFHI